MSGLPILDRARHRIGITLSEGLRSEGRTARGNGYFAENDDVPFRGRHFRAAAPGNGDEDETVAGAATSPAGIGVSKDWPREVTPNAARSTITSPSTRSSASASEFRQSCARADIPAGVRKVLSLRGAVGAEMSSYLREVPDPTSTATLGTELPFVDVASTRRWTVRRLLVPTASSVAAFVKSNR